MSLEEITLPENYEALRDFHIKYRSYARENIEILKAEVRRLNALVFAASSEAFKQVALFNEPEIMSDIEEQISKEAESSNEQTTDIAPHTRKKGHRKPIPDHFKRIEVIHDIKEENKTCDTDGTLLHEIGRDVFEELEFVPATLRVIKHITIKYGCRVCEEKIVKSDEIPQRPIPKSIASPSLLAHIAVSKYLFSLPLYRQQQQFFKLGIDLPRNTLSQWMIRVGDLLVPLAERLHQLVLASAAIQSDETPLQVLNIEGRPSPKHCYMWVLARWGPDPVVTYHYSIDRSGGFAEQLLSGFKGYLQVDGYQGYASVCSNADIIRVGCMAHVRRKFMDFLKTIPKKEQSTHFVTEIIKMMQQLYKIEDEMRQSKITARSEVRKQRSTPILDSIHEWLLRQSVNVAENSILGRAFSYALKEWHHVIKYVDHDACEIDNNLIENAIRPFCLGKKNWLFSDTERGAQASANIFTIIQTAKRNGLDPEDYLKHILSNVALLQTPEGIESLLPWNLKQVQN